MLEYLLILGSLLIYCFIITCNSCYVTNILVYVVCVVQRYLKHFQVCEIPTDKLFILFKKNKHTLEKKGPFPQLGKKRK